MESVGVEVELNLPGVDAADVEVKVPAQVTVLLEEDGDVEVAVVRRRSVGEYKSVISEL